MNEETIKELLSVNYIRVIAEREGFIVTKVEQDYGDDLMVNKVIKLKSKKGFSYLTSGEQIGIQLKCTTEKSVYLKDGELRFRLKGRNFHHLSERKNNWIKKNYVPLILILLILPSDESKWLNLNAIDGGLTIGGKAYWYMPPDNTSPTLDKSYKTISISKENQVILGTINQLFQTFLESDAI